jgi:hypothetical protein
VSDAVKEKQFTLFSGDGATISELLHCNHLMQALDVVAFEKFSLLNDGRYGTHRYLLE